MIFCSLQLGALLDHANIKVALKVLYIEQLGLPAACKSLQNVANFRATFTLLPATPFRGLLN